MGIGLASVVGVILNLILPKTKEVINPTEIKE
jgi:xanthine/uracil permease